MAVAVALLSFLYVLPAPAQGKSKVSDKDIIGFWVCQSFTYDGEDKTPLGKEYTCVKYYGPKGEYACAEVMKSGKNQYTILPHEYGTYTFHNGTYTEMGRKGVFVITGSATAYGHWSNRREDWKKVNVPAALQKEVVSRCKAMRKLSAEMQDLVHRYILNK